MLMYLLKSGACLAILLLFYQLFLERESIHVFKRYYLLAALALSFVVPAIVFVEYVDIEPMPEIYPVRAQVTQTPEIVPIDPVTDYDMLNLPRILGWIYVFGVLLFGYKFYRNLLMIVQRIRKNPKYKLNAITKVLLKERIAPHTFFSYIFLNREKFTSNQIPQAVLLHEEAHAKQKHSLDVLIIEVLQVIFWFNPLIFLTKRCIKLNHEFLADQAVVHHGVPPVTYQHILLAFSSNVLAPQFSNSIHYSSIKKRFTVMKTKTSKKSFLLRTLLLLPLLTALLFGFSETKIVQKTASINNRITDTNDPWNTNSFYKSTSAGTTSERTVEIAGLVLDSETLRPLEGVEIYDSNGQTISKTDNRGYYKVVFDKLNQGEILFTFSLAKDGYKPLEQREHWGDLHGTVKSAFYFGLQRKDSHSQELSELVTNPSNLNYEGVAADFQSIKKGFDFEKKVNRAKVGNQKVFFEIDGSYFLVNDFSWIQVNSKKDLITIDDDRIVKADQLNGHIKRDDITGMTPIESENALFAIYTVFERRIKKLKEIATEKELYQYYELANKYHAVPIEKRVIPFEDLKILETIYRKMDGMQRASALPFPECLPKKNQDGASREEMAEYNKLAKYYNAMPKNKMKILKKDVERLEYIYALMSDKQKADAAPFPNFPEPPSPPKAPKAPKTMNEREEAAEIIEKIIEEQDPYDFVTVNPNSTGFSPSLINLNTMEKLKRAQFKKVESLKEAQEKLRQVEEGKQMEREKKMVEQEAKLREQEIAIEQEEIKLEKQEILLQVEKEKLKEQEAKMGAVSDIPHPPSVNKQNGWVVSSGANRDSRRDKVGASIPPVTPTIAVHANKDNYSKELNNAIQNYLRKNEAYEKAVDTYSNSSQGSLQDLWDTYNEAMKLYVNYYNLAQAEGNFVQPLPPYKKSHIPAPPEPPTPKSPLDHIIEMAKKEAVFYYEGKEITSDKAIELLQNNDALNIDSRVSNTKRPIVKISKKPIVIEN